MSIIFGLPVLTPPFTSSSTLKTNNSTIIRFSVWKWSNRNKYLGVATNAGMHSPLSGSLFVPSQHSLSQFKCEPPMWLSDEEKKDWENNEVKEYLRDLYELDYVSSIATQSTNFHLSMRLLLPIREHLFVTNNTWKCYDLVSEEPLIQKPRDGIVAVVTGREYFSLKDQKLRKLLPVGEGDQSDGAISSLGRYLVMFSESRYSIFDLHTNSYTDEIQNPENITCNLSSPLLADIEKKDRLVLHRFAMTSGYFGCCPRPWDSIIMAIDKSSGYLAYQVRLPSKDCWIVLDSTRNYTTGDLLYFNKEANFYVLPNAHSGDLEVWRFQMIIPSKESDINATFMDETHTDYHHVHAYLVESLNGDLLLVRRYVVAQEDYINRSGNNNFFKTDSFQVFKFNFELEEWEVMPSLGDDETIFVGANSSFSVSCTKHPNVIPNCIYFTDQVCHHGNMLHGKDNGIFHLQDGTFTTLFDPDFKYTQPPIFVCHEEERSESEEELKHLIILPQESESKVDDKITIVEHFEIVKRLIQKLESQGTLIE